MHHKESLCIRRLRHAKICVAFYCLECMILLLRSEPEGRTFWSACRALRWNAAVNGCIHGCPWCSRRRRYRESEVVPSLADVSSPRVWWPVLALRFRNCCIRVRNSSCVTGMVAGASASHRIASSHNDRKARRFGDNHLYCTPPGVGANSNCWVQSAMYLR